MNQVCGSASSAAQAPSWPTGTIPSALLALWRLLHARRPVLLAVLGCLALTAATEPAMVAVLKHTIDWGKVPVASWLSYSMLPAAILALFVARGAFAATAAHLMGGVCADAVSLLQQQLQRHMLSLHGTRVSDLPVGKSVHLLTFEIKQCADFLERVTMKLIRHVLTVVALYVSLWLLNWRLTVIAMLALPLLVLVCGASWDRLRQHTRRQIRLNEELADLLIERSHKVTAVKLHGAAEQEIRRFQGVAAELRASSLSLYKVAAMAAPLTQVLAVLLMALMITWTIHAASDGGMTKGEAVAYVTNLLLLLTPLKNLAELNGPILRSIAGMQTLLGLANLPSEADASGLFAGPVKGELELRNVKVVHDGGACVAAVSVNLKVEPGTMVAIVGPSGSGKSSLLKLLCSQIHPTGGEVRIDGRPLAQWSQAALCPQISFVPQQPQLFNRSVFENVAYGDSYPDRARAWQALVDCHLDGFVAALPLGMDSEVGVDGERLSGGQARLLAIARAFYSNSPILLLDEPTASLDAQTEIVLCRALERLRGRRTVLIVTHSPTLVACADSVLSMAHGAWHGPKAESWSA